MKSSLFAMFFLLAAHVVNGQTSSDVQIQFRNLYTDAHPELLSESQNVFVYADSLFATDNSKWILLLDSIAADTLKFGLLELPVSFEKHLYFLSKNKVGLSMNSLKRAHAANEREDSQSELFRFCSKYLISHFETSGELTFAMQAMKGLLSSSENSLESLSEKSLLQSDSLKNVLKKAEANYAVKSATDAETQKNLLQGLAAAGLFIVLLLVVLLMYKWKSNKKLKALIEKQKDTSEVDELIKKMETLKSETQQFKQTAQLTINKLNGMDASGRKAGVELQVLQTDIVKALEELRQQCEHNKATISPPVFMALQNIATRLGTSSTERIQKIQDHLK